MNDEICKFEIEQLYRDKLRLFEKAKLEIKDNSEIEKSIFHFCGSLSILQDLVDIFPFLSLGDFAVIEDKVKKEIKIHEETRKSKELHALFPWAKDNIKLRVTIIPNMSYPPNRYSLDFYNEFTDKWEIIKILSELQRADVLIRKLTTKLDKEE